MRRAAGWFLVALICFGLAGYLGLRDAQHENSQTSKLSQQACHLVGEDRRAMDAILIELAYLDSVPGKNRAKLSQQASDVFRHLDCADIDLNLNQVPKVRAPQ